MTTELTELQRQQVETQESLEETHRGLAWLSILRTAFDGGKYLKDAIANQNLVFSWLHPAESLTPHLLAQIFKERPQAKNELIWLGPDLTPEQKKQQREQRLALFLNACRHFKISTCEANFSMLEQFCNSESEVGQRIQNTQARGLIRASQQELDQFEHEAGIQRTQQLKSMSKKDLHNAVNTDFQQRREAAQAADADRVLNVKREWQSGQFKPLPRFWNGELLNAKFIRAASPQQIRKWREMYGSLQLDLRLRGED
jgi:hypothetical protein